MAKFFLYVCAAVGVILLIKPELIDIAKEEMRMRERTNAIVEHSESIPLYTGIKMIEKNYPKVPKWHFSTLEEDVGSLIYVISDARVYDIAKYRTNHDVKQLLANNKQTAIPLICDDETVLNMFAHETIRSIYLQFDDKQGMNYGRVVIDKRDCGLWSFSIEKLIEKIF